MLASERDRVLRQVRKRRLRQHRLEQRLPRDVFPMALALDSIAVPRRCA